MADKPRYPDRDPSVHGIEGGGYDNAMAMALGALCPFLDCLCGFSTPSGAADNWEEAGALLDEHLEATS